MKGADRALESPIGNAPSGLVSAKVQPYRGDIAKENQPCEMPPLWGYAWLRGLVPRASPWAASSGRTFGATVEFGHFTH
jgi:hypothetical protein